jgi:hypothetical protein
MTQQDAIAKKVGTGKLLQHRLSLLEDGLIWVREAAGWEIAIAFVTTVIIGFQQDLSTAIPFVAWIEVLPFDEMLLGATPLAVLFEAWRRQYGHDITGWFQWFVGKFPTWALTSAFAAITAATAGADIYIGVPVVGTVALPVQFFDQYVVGLPLLLIARELYLRFKAHNEPAVRINGPASHSGV